MSVRMSVVLPEDLAEIVNTLSQYYKNRSQFIEKAIRQFIVHLKREEQHQRDLEIINHYADRLNEETRDALSYQIPL